MKLYAVQQFNLTCSPYGVPVYLYFRAQNPQIIYFMHSKWTPCKLSIYDTVVYGLPFPPPHSLQMTECSSDRSVSMVV